MFEFFIKPYFHNLIKIINMFILIEKFLLIAIQPSFSTAGIIGLVTAAMILSSKMNFKNFVKFDKFTEAKSYILPNTLGMYSDS